MKHGGGDRVSRGTYWNFDSCERVDIKEEGILSGDKDAVYYRVSAAGIVAAGPVIGLVYAAFLPFIGIATLLKLVVLKIAGNAVSSGKARATFGWKPAESHLAGRKKAKEEKSGHRETKDEIS